MKLEAARQIYYFNSGKLSDVARQLALGGIAAVWIFSGGSLATAVHIKADLLRVGLLLVISLGFDLMQYAWATIAWGVLSRRKEMELGQAADFLAPTWLNRPTIGLFALKLLVIAVAYILLGIALADRLSLA